MEFVLGISVCFCKDHCINACGASETHVGQTSTVGILENLAPHSRLLRVSNSSCLADDQLL